MICADGLPIFSLTPMSVGATVFSNPTSFLPTDMTTVTGASLLITRSDQSKVLWICTLVAANFSQVEIQHALAPGDLTVLGTYSARPAVTIPNNTNPLFGTLFFFRVVAS